MENKIVINGFSPYSCTYPNQISKMLSERSIEDLDKIDSNWGDVGNWWYLDGKLEEVFHYDKAFFIHKPKGALYGKNIPVKVIGIKEKCIGFFWFDEYKNRKGEVTSVKQRGLVGFASDKDFIERANNKFGRAFI